MNHREIAKLIGKALSRPGPYRVFSVLDCQPRNLSTIAEAARDSAFLTKLNLIDLIDARLVSFHPCSQPISPDPHSDLNLVFRLSNAGETILRLIQQEATS